MLSKKSTYVLAQQNVKVTPAKSSWTYDSTAGSQVVTVYAPATPLVGDKVSLAPSGGGFASGIYVVQTVSENVSFTCKVMGDTTTVSGGAFAGTGELQLFKCALPAGTLGYDGTLVVEGKFSCTASTGAKKLHFYLGTEHFSLLGFNNVAAQAGIFRASVSNRGAMTKQIGGFNDASQGQSFQLVTGLALATLSQNTGTDLDVVVACERATALEGFLLESIRVIIEPGNF